MYNFQYFPVNKSDFCVFHIYVYTYIYRIHTSQIVESYNTLQESVM